MLNLSKRRWYQFSLRTLLSLPLLFAAGWLIFSAGWWWVTWPERTAIKYREATINGTLEEARAFLSSSRVIEPAPGMIFCEDDFQRAMRIRVTPEPRSMADFLLSRQSFEVAGLYSEVKGFTVCRGKVLVIYGFELWLSPPPDYSLSREAAKFDFDAKLQQGNAGEQDGILNP